jgi:hypothetical protein
VPPLDGNANSELKGSVRERLEKHRSAPGCASCQALIDPLGFGLENFDAIGAQREQDNGVPLDTTGVLTTGQTFHNAIELSGVILNDKRDAFLRCIISKLFTYALGRGPEAYDRPTQDAILTRLKQENYGFQTLIASLIESVPFQKRRGEAPPIKAK